MQSTGGLINDIIVFAIFIYLVLLVNGNVKLGQSNQAKWDNVMQRKGSLLKILVYLGVVLFALLILKSFFLPDNSQRANASNADSKHHQWTSADKEEMTRDCIASAKEAYQKDSARITALCECVTEKFTSKYTYDQVEELNKKPDQEKRHSILPIVETCKADMKTAK